MRVILYAFCLLPSLGLSQQFVIGGFTFAQTTQEPPPGAVGRLIGGFSAGLAFQRQLTQRMMIRPELIFIQKGTRVTTTSEQLKITTNYIELPVLLGVSLNRETQPVMIFVEGGLSVGYGIGGKYKFISPVNPFGGTVKFGEPDPNNPNDLYLDNAVDVAFQAGLAIVVRQKYLIDLRFSSSTTSTTDPPDPLPAGSTRSDFHSYNRVLQFTFGMAVGR